MKNILAALKVLYANRKAEIALVVAALALAREVVQAASGH
jgi:hypothetical protein